MGMGGAGERCEALMKDRCQVRTSLRCAVSNFKMALLWAASTAVSRS